jgi:hypothetical protein
MTQERVMGSLRNCILARITLRAIVVNSARISGHIRVLPGRYSGDTPYFPGNLPFEQQQL